MAHTHGIKENPSQALLLAALSAVTGALIATLITPARGKDVRQSIGEKINKSKGSFNNIVRSKKYAASDEINNIKEKANETRLNNKSGEIDKNNDGKSV